MPEIPTIKRQALYRKYRPQQFSEIVEQAHVLRALQGAIAQNLVSHAYLFHGGRGTGKTSIARIFAKELGTKESDLYEIDAASHTSIENIKELNESVYTLPFESPYKVYILDEVHMLSKSAWNAFLKTLEEPPAYVIFILATTEIEKVPDTILSRCQVFSFKKPSRKVLKEVIEVAAEKEGYKLEEGVSELIALFGDGSFRDTYGTLEKAIGVSKDKKISLEEVQAVTGAPQESLVLEMVEAIALKQRNELLKAYATAMKQGIDASLLLELLIERLRLLLLVKIDAPTVADIKGELPDFSFEKLTSLVGNPSSVLSSAMLMKLLDIQEKMSKSIMAEMVLELTLIDISSS